jgi:hypothetical protein
MKRRQSLLVVAVIVALVVIVVGALFLLSTKPTPKPTLGLLKTELPDNVTVNVLPDWNQTKSLGSKEEGRLITFQGKEIVMTVTYVPLKDVNITYGTTQLEGIANTHLKVLEATYGKYNLESKEKIRVNGHDATAIKISYLAEDKTYVSQQILWICSNSERLFILSITAPKSIFESNEGTFKTIIDSITCH